MAFACLFRFMLGTGCRRLSRSAGSRARCA